MKTERLIQQVLAMLERAAAEGNYTRLNELSQLLRTLKDDRITELEKMLTKARLERRYRKGA